MKAPKTQGYYYFEDGYYCICRGFSAQKMRVEIRKHGKCINKVFVVWDDELPGGKKNV